MLVTDVARPSPSQTFNIIRRRDVMAELGRCLCLIAPRIGKDRQPISDRCPEMQEQRRNCLMRGRLFQDGVEKQEMVVLWDLRRLRCGPFVMLWGPGCARMRDGVARRA
jgi:hypothetical protein